MEDVTPELLKNVQDDFNRLFNNNKLIKSVYELGDKATYEDANEFACEVGDILAKAFSNNISSDVLPDGKMYYNIASRIITPTMEKNYNIISKLTSDVQKTLNEKAGLGLNTVTPGINQDRIDGMINRISSEDVYDNVAWILDEPVKNFSQSIIDDFIDKNVEFQGKAGMSPKVIRKLAGHCCEWCAAVAGTYTYPNVPKDVFRRHQRCRCIVEYDPRSGKKQNIWTKEWKTQADNDRIIERKRFAQARLKTGKMTPKEHADYKRDLDQVKNEPEIRLEREEYAHIMSEINNNITDEDMKQALIVKPIGNNYYTFINRGFNNYTIIKKEPIVSDIDNEFWED